VITMEVWESIRLRCHRDGEKIKPTARDLGIAPNTLRKYLRQGGPPKRAATARPKLLDRYVTHIDELIRSTPKITAVRVGSYLRQNVDAELQVDERTLREYVAARRAVLVPKEAFVRAAYAPGDQSQFDFSPMSVLLAGVLVVVQLFVVRLSYSGRFTARASMRCDQPSLFEGLLAGFTVFGGLTRTSIFDNASTAVKRILRGRNREENEAFAAFRGGLALHVDFAAPGKGNEKGGVEGVHGYIEDNFFRPLPSFADLDELNAGLVVFCDLSLTREHSTHHETIGERFAREQPALQTLPPVLPRPCVTRYARINKFAEVCFERNWYSVPTRWAHRNAFIEVHERRLRIVVDTEIVAEHRRGFSIGERFLDPRHYVTLLAHKHRAAESALVLSDGRIPDVLRDLFERYRQTNAGTATKRWTQVLALLTDVPVTELAQVVTHALALGTDDPAAIALLLAQKRAPAPTASLRSSMLPESARYEAPVVNLNAYATEQLMESAA
jgi:transposase